MPFAAKKQMDENQPGEAAPNISGVSTMVNVPGQPAQARGQQQKSGQYQNIEKYLAANAPQAEAMGQKIAGNVEQKVGAAQQATQGLQGSVQKVADYDPSKVLSSFAIESATGIAPKDIQDQQTAVKEKNRITLPADFVPTKNTRPVTATQGLIQKDFGPDVSAKPKSMYAPPTAEQKAQYQQMKQTGGYTGAQDISRLSGYGEAKQAQKSALEDVSAAGTEVGQKELLKTAYQRPTYTGGAQSLDQSLLQRSQGGRQAVEGLAQKYSGLASQFGATEQQAAADIAAQQAKAKQIQSSFAPAEQAAKTAIMTPIEQRVAAANAQKQAFQGQVEDLSDLKLKQDTMAALGLAPGRSIYDLDLSSYVNPESMAASVQNIATEGERQKYNQLLDFLGSNTGELGIGQPTYQAGGFDTAKLSSDLANKEAEYQNAFNTYDLSGAEPDLYFLKDKTPAGVQRAIESGTFNSAYNPYYQNVLEAALKRFNDKFGKNRIIGAE